MPLCIAPGVPLLQHALSLKRNEVASHPRNSNCLPFFASAHRCPRGTLAPFCQMIQMAPMSHPATAQCIQPRHCARGVHRPTGSQVSTSHTRTVWSCDADGTRGPSRDSARHVSSSVCACRTCATGCPVSTSHTRTVLPHNRAVTRVPSRYAQRGRTGRG